MLRDAIDALLRTHEMAIEVVVTTSAQPRRRPLTRRNLRPGHTYYDGISEDISIDHMLASPRGTSKVAAGVRGQQDDRGDPAASVAQRPAATTRLHTPRQ